MNDTATPGNRERGYIRLYRSQFDVEDALWRRVKVKNQWDAWQYLISIARWSAEPAIVDVQGTPVTVNRGEFLISQRSLAAALGWGRQAVRGFLELLLRLHRIAPSSQPTGQPTCCHYKLRHYETYNNVNDDSNPPINPPSNPAATQEQPSSNPILEGKERSDSREPTPDSPSPEAPAVPVTPTAAERREAEAAGIVAFYLVTIARPGDDSAARAKKHVAKVLKKHTPEVLRRCVERYADACAATDKQPQYRDAAGNFFGTKGTFEAYLPDVWELPCVAVENPPPV